VTKFAQRYIDLIKLIAQVKYTTGPVKNGWCPALRTPMFCRYTIFYVGKRVIAEL